MFSIFLLRKELIISHHPNQKRIAFFKFLTPPASLFKQIHIFSPSARWKHRGFLVSTLGIDYL